MDVTIRRIPGHHWVRLFVSLTGRCEPGHGWLYCDLVRRDAWRIGRVGFGTGPMGSGLTHWEGCWQHHAGCLAARMLRQLTGEVADRG